MTSVEAESAVQDDYGSSRGSRFRFKSKSQSDDDLNASSRRKRHRQSRHEDERKHGYRSKRRKNPHNATSHDDPTLYDDSYLPNLQSSQYLSPDAAFRESLFDAMADDEGADYWERVYGQPLHVYSKEKQGPDGELERMTDEEYTAYVRAKMYEKTHQHMIEERERRKEARQREREMREEGRQMRQEQIEFEKRIEESLRRGEERKLKKSLKERWEAYSRSWDILNGLVSGGDGEIAMKAKDLRDKIPWPVQTGRFSDVTRENVEKFFHSAPKSREGTEEAPDILILLKAERVRWHPDKMQQRLGIEGLDKDAMGAVTAVFQVVDGMWSELRAKKDREARQTTQ